MRTVHAADRLRLTPTGEPTAGGAVLVAGDRIERIASLGELTEAYPGVRVRRWAGSLGPALVHDAPLPPAPSPRERVHALFRVGVGAVLADQLTDPALRAAAARNGLAVLDRPRPPTLVARGGADLGVLGVEGTCQATK
ncbi:hypothetical protein, partial [Micromonospora sp. NPDC003776]